MAGRGFTASGRAQKKSRNVTRELVKSDGKLGGYVLPAGVLGVDDDGVAIDWHPATKAWWLAWRASPQSTKMMTEPDWSFLLDTARMHHELWSAGTLSFAAEIRLRVAKLGATPEDRLRLRIDIDLPDDDDVAAAPTTARHDARRERWADDPIDNVTHISTPKF